MDNACQQNTHEFALRELIDDEDDDEDMELDEDDDVDIEVDIEFSNVYIFTGKLENNFFQNNR